MEKKEPIKVSLSTFFLIIAIIIICIMGYFMYKLYSDKNIETDKANELKKQVENLNNTITDLQGKINTINNTINTNKTSESTNNNTEFTEEEVNKAISEYLELRSSANCGTPLEVLKEKGVLNNYDSSKYDINTNTGEITTNIKFSEYKKAMLNYVTESEFEKNWTSKIYLGESSNGYLTHFQGGGGLRVYTIKSVSKIDSSTFSVKTSSVVEENEYYEENNYTVIVKSSNGKCVIDSCK